MISVIIVIKFETDYKYILQYSRQVPMGNHIISLILNNQWHLSS